MLFLSNRKKWQPQTRQNMMQYICYTDYVLNSIQEMLHLQKEKRIKEHRRHEVSTVHQKVRKTYPY